MKKEQISVDAFVDHKFKKASWMNEYNSHVSSDIPVKIIPLVLLGILSVLLFVGALYIT